MTILHRLTTAHEHPRERNSNTMSKTMSHILKGETFEISGRHRISLTGHPGAASQPSASQPQAQAQAHVVERHPEYAMIEVTCSCGSTMYVRCDYVQAPESPVIEAAETD